MPGTYKPIRDQVMVITGASSGIGLATALTAIEKGAKVVLAARSGEVLADIVRRTRSAAAQAIYVVADVAYRDQVEGIASAAVGRFGHVDTWVNNAGVSIYGRLDEVSEEDSRRLFDTNFWGVVHGSLVALPLLRQSQGTLINVGSEVSDAVIPLQGMYSASKHAVKGFTDALRVEVEDVDRSPVSITLIQPTAVDTPYPEHARNYMNREPKLPAPRIDPQRVADAIIAAAQRPRRDIKVGLGAKINTMLAKLAPAIGDVLSAKQVDRQQRDEPPRNPQGTLYSPGGDGRIKGRDSSGRARDASTAATRA